VGGMAAVVECGCGEVLEAEDDESLLAEAEGHVAAVHPELVGTLSPLELAGREPAERAVA
jgi:hypothetical protein